MQRGARSPSRLHIALTERRFLLELRSQDLVSEFSPLRNHTPQGDLAIIRGTDQRAPIGRKGHTPDPAPGTDEGAQNLARYRIPKAYRAVGRRAGEQTPLMTEGHVVHPVSVPFQDRELRAGAHVPQADGPIPPS